MIPDPDLQLQVVITALRDVVAPGMSPTDRRATEQLHLAIATLGLVRSRLPMVAAFRRAEFEDALNLGDRLCALSSEPDQADALRAVTRRAHAAVDEILKCSHDLESLTHELQAASCAVVESAQEPAYREIALAVVKAAKPGVDRARAWCLPAGFESDPAQVGQLEDILS
jgi:hypothetical protein